MQYNTIKRERKLILDTQVKWVYDSATKDHDILA